MDALNEKEGVKISRYLTKYVGKYRVVANYNLDTNDFPRLLNGNIDQSYDDIYIMCQKGRKIYHYGGNILETYIPSIQKGRNILKQLYLSKTQNTNLSEFEIKSENNTIFNYELFYTKLKDLDVIIDIIETSEEIYFKFKNKDIELVAEFMGAKTAGANISPFSKKNLPKKKYQIPLQELESYKKITSVVPKGDLLIISRITSRFITDILRKKAKVFDINADMKLKMLKGKEYIYDMGYFEEYLKYLEKNLKEIIK